MRECSALCHGFVVDCRQRDGLRSRLGRCTYSFSCIARGRFGDRRADVSLAKGGATE